MKKIRVVFFGTPEFAVPSLKRLLSHSEFEVVAVVTQPDKRRGRGSKVTPSPVKAAAADANCPIWQPSRIKKDAETLAQLDALKADAFVVIAYGQILSQAILDMPRFGCVNAHGSILPKYRGAAPIQWCIHDGEATTGVTTMLMDAGMDTGPMLIEETIPIGLEDNAWEVAKKLSELSADLLVTTLQKLQQQQIQPVPQNDSQATYAPLIKKKDYSLDWSKSAKAIHDKVRGFYPNCVTSFRETPVKIIKTLPLGDAYWPMLSDQSTELRSALAEPLQRRIAAATIDSQAQPGTIVAILKNHGPVIATGDGELLLQAVKPAGKKVLSGWDFANGSRLDVGDVLGNLA